MQMANKAAKQAQEKKRKEAEKAPKEAEAKRKRRGAIQQKKLLALQAEADHFMGLTGRGPGRAPLDREGIATRNQGSQRAGLNGTYIQPATPRKSWSLGEPLPPDWVTLSLGQKVTYVDGMAYVVPKTPLYPDGNTAFGTGTFQHSPEGLGRPPPLYTRLQFIIRLLKKIRKAGMAATTTEVTGVGDSSSAGTLYL